MNNTITPDTESIINIVEKIDAGTVSLPEFQRDFVWDISRTFDLFDSLSKDVHGTLELEETRKLKGIKGVNKAFEIKKGNMRIFYTLVNDDIHILHTSIKQKNKTEQHASEPGF